MYALPLLVFPAGELFEVSDSGLTLLLGLTSPERCFRQPAWSRYPFQRDRDYI